MIRTMVRAITALGIAGTLITSASLPVPASAQVRFVLPKCIYVFNRAHVAIHAHHSSSSAVKGHGRKGHKFVSARCTSAKNGTVIWIKGKDPGNHVSGWVKRKYLTSPARVT